MLLYLRDGSAQTVVCAAILRYKLQIKLAISPSDQSVPALTLPTLKRQAPGRIVTGVPIFKSLA